MCFTNSMIGCHISTKNGASCDGDASFASYSSLTYMSQVAPDYRQTTGLGYQSVARICPNVHSSVHENFRLNSELADENVKRTLKHPALGKVYLELFMARRKTIGVKVKLEPG